MSVNEVKKVRFLEIMGQSGLAVYDNIRDVNAVGSDHRKIITDAAQADIVPAGTPPTFKGKGLDIDLGSDTGTVAFAIRLPKNVLVNGSWVKSNLEFVDPPVVQLPSNYRSEETYLTFPLKQPGNKRWAWFECDLESIRLNSKVCEMVKAQHNHAGQRKVMRIPFVLNVIDTKLGFAPWMLPPEPLLSPPPPFTSDETASKGIFASIMTHGGVHPTVGNYVVMDVAV